MLGKTPAQAVRLANIDQRTLVIELIHTLARREATKFLIRQWSGVKTVKGPDQLI